jgi:hypothetical protein
MCDTYQMLIYISFVFMESFQTILAANPTSPYERLTATSINELEIRQFGCDCKIWEDSGGWTS